jgi:mannan endo-1,4-beta-mannosidase
MNTINKFGRQTGLVGLLQVVLALTLLTSGCKTASPVASREPVNKNASPEVRALLSYLYQISGHNILAGQHNQPGIKPDASAMSEKAEEITGKYPAIWGCDFGFKANGLDGINNRPGIVAEAIRQYHNGSIINLMWHSVSPLDNEPGEWKQNVWHKLTEAEWNELITPGTPLNQHWLAQLDVVAGYLEQLRDAHVPVLWRPFHEMNGNWFWWGQKKGDKGIKALWQLEYERLANHHHLNNLIWVWSPNTPDGGAKGFLADYYPGPGYVDVLGLDVYTSFKQEYYNELLKLAAGKPIALGEVGTLPSPAVLDSQPRWVWFLEWNSRLIKGNKPEQVKALYDDPRTLTRDEAKWN